MKIFIIGPGGVGKSTVGKILAQKLGYYFIDLDGEFCEKIENVGVFINTRGYEEYCQRNSDLFLNILNQKKDNFVFALSSGFLVHDSFDQLTLKNQQTLEKAGITVLLLPSESLEESTEIVIKRQLKRGFGLKEDREREKFRKRFREYQQFGDIKIYSCKEPELIALEILDKLNTAISN